MYLFKIFDIRFFIIGYRWLCIDTNLSNHEEK